MSLVEEILHFNRKGTALWRAPFLEVTKKDAEGARRLVTIC